MSLQYLLDGYNIIHKMPQTADLKLEDQRDHLVRHIEKARPQGSLRNRVVVIFDGQPGMGGQVVAGSVHVIYSQGRSADDKIKAIVEEAENPKQIVVVTDDREIQFAVRSSGSKVMPVDEFLKAGSAGKNRTSTAPKKHNTGAKQKRVPKSVEAKITRELEDVWLKKKQKRKSK